jgi:hypothetical protein
MSRASFSCALAFILQPAVLNCLTIQLQQRHTLAFDPRELTTAPKLEECGMVFLSQAFAGLQPKLHLPADLNLQAGMDKDKAAIARVEGGRPCNSSEISLAARLVSAEVIVGLEPRSVANSCAWEVPLWAPRTGTYQLEVTLLWYHEGGTWGLDASSQEECTLSSETSGSLASMPQSLQGEIPKQGEQTPLYTNMAQDGRWVDWCTWCRHSFFADRFVMPSGSKGTFARPFQHKVNLLARGAAAPDGAQVYSCAKLKRERYLGGLSVSNDVLERGKCRKLSTSSVLQLR